MVEPRRVVVTGIGCITPAGSGAAGLWAGVRRGRSPVRLLDRFDATPFRSRLAAQVADFDPLDYVEKKQAGRLARFAQYAMAAGRQALADAGLEPARLDRERCGVFMGSALGGSDLAEEQHSRYLSYGARGVNPMLALAVFGGAASCNLAIEFGFTGPNETNAMSCASGAVALARALQAIRAGQADAALAGGAEAPLAPLCYGAFAIIRAMSQRNEAPQAACRPFDRRRDGFVMGEGAAVLFLEEAGHARRRGARIYAELAGCGITNDAHHMTAPLPDGREAARAMRLALADASLAPAEIGYINAHASSTPLNDAMEARAIRSVFSGVPVPVSGTKALYGHALGASGAIEAAITSLALHHGWLPPTINLDDPDPEADFPLLRGEGQTARPAAALSNSFGFGGINACLAFRRA